MATLNIKRFPDQLYEELRARAEQEHRSVSQEVVHLLARAVERPQALSVLELRGLGKELWSGVDGAAHVDRERGSWD